MLNINIIYRNTLSKVVFLSISAFFCASWIISFRNSIRRNASSHQHNRLLRNFDYRIIENRLCSNDYGDHCSACNHLNDAIERHSESHIAVEENLKSIQKEVRRIENDIHAQTKIVFLGDSITEFMNGRLSGRYNKRWSGYKAVFDKYFKNGAIALGVGGDTVSK